jgi:hypothetical protein
MKVIPKFLCRRVGHRRSSRGAYLDEQEHRWRSVCRRCGVPLRKHGLRGWEEVRAEEEEMEARAGIEPACKDLQSSA